MHIKSDIAISTVVDSLNKHIPRLMAQAGVPGLSLALIQDAELAWTQGFGLMNINTGEPVTTDTLFEACSLGKPPFAYVALMLHDQQVLDLDASLSGYLSESLVESDPRLESITMRNVLCHTCGLPNWRPKDQSLKIRLPPGERFSYSGEGYMYLQKVIEQITNKTGEEVMQSMLLQPLGLAKSTYLWSKEYTEPIATGYDPEGKSTEKFYPDSMWSATSLHSTPTEYAQFMIAMMKQDNDNSSLLTPEMTKLMYRHQVYVNDSVQGHDDWPRDAVMVDEHVSWGLGWGIQHHETCDSFWHWGDNDTFTAFAAGFPDQGVGVVIMTNSTNGEDIFEQVCLEAIGGDYPGLRWLKQLSGYTPYG